MSAGHTSSTNAMRTENSPSAKSPSREVLFAGLILIGFLNGTVSRAMVLYDRDPAGAVWSALGISVFAWAACVVAIALCWRAPRTPVSGRDAWVASVAVVFFLFPAAPASWLALTGLGIYLAATSRPGSECHGAAWILAALTVPMFWSKLLISLFGDIILAIDGVLVGLVLNTERVGNTIAFADGWGYFWIAPECSSLANVSLAVLCWVLVTRSVASMRRLPLVYFAATIATVMAINIARMGLTGLSRAHYELIHGPVGNVVFDLLTTAAIAAIILCARKAVLRNASRSRDHESLA